MRRHRRSSSRARRGTRSKLARERNRWRRIFLDAPTGMAIVDQRGRWVEVNPGAVPASRLPQGRAGGPAVHRVHAPRGARAESPRIRGPLRQNRERGRAREALHRSRRQRDLGPGHVLAGLDDQRWPGAPDRSDPGHHRAQAGRAEARGGAAASERVPGDDVPTRSTSRTWTAASSGSHRRRHRSSGSRLTKHRAARTISTSFSAEHAARPSRTSSGSSAPERRSSSRGAGNVRRRTRGLGLNDEDAAARRDRRDRSARSASRRHHHAQASRGGATRERGALAHAAGQLAGDCVLVESPAACSPTPARRSSAGWATASMSCSGRSSRAWSTRTIEPHSWMRSESVRSRPSSARPVSLAHRPRHKDGSWHRTRVDVRVLAR